MFFGLSMGSVLVLVAIGLGITFGVMGVINMAHGELMMLGAYTTYVVQTAMPAMSGRPILVAIPAAFLVAGLTGILIERVIIRHLYGRPLETLLATFGVSLVLQQTVRSIFTALNRSVETPPWMSGTLQINEALGITYNRLYIILFTLIVFGLLLVVLKRTRLGLNIRAVAQNRAMARAMGVRSEWVDAMTFGLGSGIAGVAGVALSQLTNVGPNLGQAYIIDSFMVVVFGGVGSLWGALIGGMSMGIVNQLLEPLAGAVSRRSPCSWPSFSSSSGAPAGSSRRQAARPRASREPRVRRPSRRTRVGSACWACSSRSPSACRPPSCSRRLPRRYTSRPTCSPSSGSTCATGCSPWLSISSGATAAF
jgi:urea transport system permease protein